MLSRIYKIVRAAAFGVSFFLLSAVPCVAQSDLSDVRPLLVQPTFSELFHQIGRDFRAFPSKHNLIWLGFGGSLSLSARPIDSELTTSLSGARRVKGTLEPGRFLGSSMVQFGGSFATYALGRVSKKPSVTHIGSDLLRAQVLAQGITQGTKFATRRTRPDGTSLSFPSGHSAAAFSTATVLQNHYGWKIGVPTYALASYVAASRLSENRHYASDVIFGATVGILAARTVTLGHGSLRFSVVPFPTPSGGGIALVKIWD